MGQTIQVWMEYKPGALMRVAGVVTAVTLEELLTTREALIGKIVGEMPENHRRFLISIKGGRPEWKLLDLPDAEKLPAVCWRLENLARLDEKRRATLVGRLSEVLGMPE